MKISKNLQDAAWRFLLMYDYGGKEDKKYKNICLHARYTCIIIYLVV